MIILMIYQIKTQEVSLFHALAAFVLRMRIIGDINILLYPLMQK